MSPGQAAIAPSATMPASGAAGSRRRASPSGSAEDRHGDDGEGHPPGIHARGAEGQDGKHRQSRKRGGGDPIGLGGIVGNGQMRLDRHERGGERKLDGNVDEERRRPRDFAAQVHAAGQREAPDHGARDRRGGEP